MKTVLVSGGCGFLGSHLVDRLLLRDDVELILVVDNLWTGRTKNLAHVNDARLDIVECNVEKFASKTRFDEIIHLASPASPPWYMREPVRVIQANVHGALNLLDHLAPRGRMSYTSTSEVYGDPFISPQPESYRGSVDCTGPRSSYDESKRCTEALLFESQRVSALDIRVARLFNVYGPRTRIDDGRAISNFLGQALTTGELTVYGDGLQSRSWGYIDDIVEGLARFFWRDQIRYRGPLTYRERPGDSGHRHRAPHPEACARNDAQVHAAGAAGPNKPAAGSDHRQHGAARLEGGGPLRGGCAPHPGVVPCRTRQRRRTSPGADTFVRARG